MQAINRICQRQIKENVLNLKKNILKLNNKKRFKIIETLKGDFIPLHITQILEAVKLNLKLSF